MEVKPLILVIITVIVIVIGVGLIFGKFSPLSIEATEFIKQLAECPVANRVYFTEDECKDACSCHGYFCKKIEYKWKCVKRCEPATEECKGQGDKCCIDQCPLGYEQITADCPERRICCRKK